MKTFEECLEIVRSRNPLIFPKEYAEFSSAFIFYMWGHKAFDGAILADRRTGDVGKVNDKSVTIIPKEEFDNVEFKTLY